MEFSFSFMNTEVIKLFDVKQNLCQQFVFSIIYTKSFKVFRAEYCQNLTRPLLSRSFTIHRS
jgi:hypothetical protein